MVQIFTAITAIAALTPLASAALCTRDREWCGSHLQLMDSTYANKIYGALLAYGFPTTDDYRNNTLFSCTNSNGGIAVWTYCGDGADTCYVDNRYGDSCPS